MLRLALVSTALTVTSAFLQPSHSCGDSQSRLHLRNSCKYALYQLDQLVPDMESALDEHNRRNFRDVLKHPETVAARKAVQDCFACVLAGNSLCDVKPRETGDHSLHKLAKEWHGIETGLSQNCRDHMESRTQKSTGAFRPADLHVHDSVSLMEEPSVQIVSSGPKMIPRILADATAMVGGSTDTTALSANDPTLEQEKVGKLYESSASPELHVDNQMVQDPKRELAEPQQDTFICAQIDHNLAGEVVCPEGQRITQIEFASYGTPNNADYKLDANLTDTVFTTRRNGVKIFQGDKCFNMDYASRSDCNAYDSRELVDKICHGATRCTLSAVGDKKKLMSFQPLVCDLKLKLYVKARCSKGETTDALGRSTLASKEISMMGVTVDEVSRAATIDLSNPDHTEFKPGQLPLISLAEIESGARPIVRAPIDPPAQFYNAFALKGEGRMCFKCGYTGITDEDGMIYYWRPCDEEPKLSYVNLSPISGTDGVQASWNGETNTYVSSKDGSFVKPEDTPTGLVSDYSMDQTSKTPVVNAPDFLYHVVSASSAGVFAGVQYVQRFQTTNGMPPNSNGNIVVNGITYNKCNAAQARDNIAAEVPISATYVFYKERQSGAAPAPAGIPAWGILLIVCGALLLVALVVLAVLGKVPGFQRHSEEAEEIEQEHLAEDEDESHL